MQQALIEAFDAAIRASAQAIRLKARWNKLTPNDYVRHRRLKAARVIALANLA